MTTTQIPIPEYDGRTGNFMRGRQGTAVDTIVYHHIAGSLDAADMVFADPRNVKSAHRAISDEKVHEYVKLTDTAFGAGNWGMNLRCVNKEHADLPGGGFSDATYETSAHDTYAIARSFGKKVSDFRHVPHSAVVPTACPGGLDIERIVRHAMELEAAANMPQAVLTSAVKVPVRESAFATPSDGVKVRTTPHALSDNSNWKDAVAGKNGRTILPGAKNGFWYVATEEGDGMTWLKLENDNGYVAAKYTTYNPNQSA